MAMKTKEKKKFQYKERSVDTIRKRAAEAKGGGRDGFIKEGIKFFKPNNGDNAIRIMPPTWEDAVHYGYDVYVHYNIGPDNAAYACLNKMKGKSCPICQESNRAKAEGDAEAEKQYRPTKRVLVYVLDRDKEKEGPKIWPMGLTLDDNINKLTEDRRTGEVYRVDHDKKGYDVYFTREGTGLNTKYTGVALARKPTPIGDEEALEFVVENPIPDIIQYYDYDHIKLAFTGEGGDSEDEEKSSKKKKRKEDDEDERPSKKSKKVEEEDEEDEDEEEEDEDEEDEKPSKKSKKVEEEDEEDEEDEEEEDEDEEEEDEEEDEKPAKTSSVTYEQVTEMDDEELLALCSKNATLRKHSTFDADDYDDSEELREAIIEALELRPASKRERLKNLKK